MKFLLFVALLCPALGQSQALAWPHHQQTGRVEFTGFLAWPATAITPVQRHALVRRWYTTKLCDEKPATIVAWRIESVPLTYAALPGWACFDHQRDPDHHARLAYLVHLTATTAGVAYHFSDFDYTWMTEDTAGTEPLEKLLADPDLDASTLRVFRQRLATAVAGW
jgi:hypothetical protein